MTAKRVRPDVRTKHVDPGTRKRRAAERATVMVDGRRVSLADVSPLVAFVMRCSHMGREYGVAVGDVVFCETCGTDRKIARVIAA